MFGVVEPLFTRSLGIVHGGRLGMVIGGWHCVVDQGMTCFSCLSWS